MYVNELATAQLQKMTKLYLRENITLLPAASFFFFLFVTVSDHISRKPRCRFSAILPCSWRRNVAFYIEWLQKPLTTMFPVTETQSSTRPQRLLNVLRRERILKPDSSDVLAKFSKTISSLLARNSFVNTCHFLSKVLQYQIIYLRESRRRKSKSCCRMRRPTADFENTANVRQKKGKLKPAFKLIWENTYRKRANVRLMWECVCCVLGGRWGW